jgi:hypothetical protein
LASRPGIADLNYPGEDPSPIPDRACHQGRDLSKKSMTSTVFFQKRDVSVHPVYSFMVSKGNIVLRSWIGVKVVNDVFGSIIGGVQIIEVNTWIT